MMLKCIVIFGLVYSAVNWALFAWSALARSRTLAASKSLENFELQGLNPNKMLTEAGSLAGAFKAAGATATAAAMSLVGLVVAAVAAGIDKY
jgi:HAMP domain-containing protein